MIPERRSGTCDVEYQASSPDESALVKAVQKLGIVFYARHPQYISVQFQSIEHKFEVLNVIEFNSVRKRMSVILRDMNGEIKLYSKGADNVMLARASQTDNQYIDVTLQHLEAFAKDGFRTLVLAYRVISEKEYQVRNCINSLICLSLNV